MVIHPKNLQLLEENAEIVQVRQWSKVKGEHYSTTSKIEVILILHKSVV